MSRPYLGSVGMVVSWPILVCFRDVSAGSVVKNALRFDYGSIDHMVDGFGSI